MGPVGGLGAHLANFFPQGANEGPGRAEGTHGQVTDKCSSFPSEHLNIQGNPPGYLVPRESPDSSGQCHRCWGTQPGLLFWINAFSSELGKRVRPRTVKCIAVVQVLLVATPSAGSL